MSMKTRTLDQFSRKDVLEGLAFVQKYQALLTVFERLLLARLVRLASSPAQDRNDELLTVPEVAARLGLSKPRVYELLRAREISAVRIGERQVRVSRHDLAQYLDDHRATKQSEE